MIIDKYPWLEDCINQNSINNFPPASVIEGEVGLAKLQLALYFAKQFYHSAANTPLISILDFPHTLDSSITQ